MLTLVNPIERVKMKHTLECSRDVQLDSTLVGRAISTQVNNGWLELS
jgi:hypothetical protein